MKSIIVTTQGQSWQGFGETTKDAIMDAFEAIKLACENDDGLKIGQKFSLRESHEPPSKDVDGYDTIDFLRNCGELDETQAWILREGIKRYEKRKAN